MSFKKKLLPLALAQVIAGGAFSVMSIAPVMAQEAAAPVQRVEITGSNIRRADAETPSPVQVLTADDLKKSGYTTVAQVLENLTANGQGTLSQGFSGAFATGASGLSLHGLNTSATLVLIDGHRMASYPLPDDGQRFFVDVAGIPFDAIERVEVLKDGASATYGSDAMAGVINFILKKKFVGTTVGAEYGSSTEGGGQTAHMSVMSGIGDLDADGYNAYVNLEYRHQDAITFDQRKGDGLWSSQNFSNYIDSNSHLPALNMTPGVINSVVPNPNTRTVYLVNPTKGAGFTAASTYFYNTPIQPNASYNGSCTFASLQAGACTYSNPNAAIEPATHNLNLLGSVTKKLGEDWQLNVKASMFESADDDYRGDSTTQRLTAFPKAYNGEPIGSATTTASTVPGIAAIRVPANYPGNPFGVPAVVKGIIPDAPSQSSKIDSKAYRIVGDLTGTLGSWDIDTSVGWSKIVLDNKATGGINENALNAALNAPNGSPGQFLITGGNSPALMASLFPTTDTTDTTQLQFAEVHASHTLAQLPGGDLGFSVGGSVIHSTIDSPAAALRENGTITGSLAYFDGTQTDASAYMELVAPVLKNLEFDGSVRYDHFNTDANATTPKLGFKYTPAPEVTLRGTISQGFRTPNAAEGGNSGAVYSAGTTFDPILCPNGVATAKGAVISQCNFAPAYLTGAGPLKPEKSTSETFGLILEPIKGWSTTADMYRIKIKDQIIGGPANISAAHRGQPLSETCSDGAGGNTTCTTSVGEILYIPSPYVNANSTTVSGWEIDTRYKFKLGDLGNLTTDFDWSHTMSYVLSADYVGNGYPSDYQLAGTHGPATIGGNTGNPKDRIQATLTWEKSALQVTTTFNWIGSFDLTDPSGSNGGGAINDCKDASSQGGAIAAWFPAGGPPSQFCKVNAFLDTDLTVRYKIDKNWTIHGNINNLFNQAPPLDINTYGSALPFNPSMHLAGAIGRFINIGANYTF
ncbi:MAG TPA: TonB-dependent receptor [Burkholderiaceae bacterium]|jgi:iron complex outermembrane receptor protein|nr:TonB-dependent receptor [Burkholderiaceae bacterium]